MKTYLGLPTTPDNAFFEDDNSVAELWRHKESVDKIVKSAIIIADKRASKISKLILGTAERQRT